MKILINVIILFTCLCSFSQCRYEKVEFNNTTNQALLQLSPITLDIFETPINGRIIIASLIRIDSQYFIEIEITKDSTARELEPICFEKGTRLSFSLQNGSIVSLSQREEKICGVKYYDKKTNYSTVSNFSRFILTQTVFDALIKSEVIMMKINSDNFEKTYVLKDELEEKIGDEIIITSPGRFFMDNIKCLTNPQFE